MSDICQILPTSRVEEAARVMADAFSDSPAYNYIFQGDVEYRKEALEWVFRQNIDLIRQRCPTALRGMYDMDTGDIQVCFLWTPSPYHDISLWDLLYAGFWRMPFRYGFFTVYRLLRAMGDLDRGQQMNFHHNPLTDGIPFVTLERMAVRSDCRGKGLGTKALTSIIREFVTSNESRYLRLTTQEERNVRFYQRLGYTVAGSEELCSENEIYRYASWYMIFDAKNILSPPI
jgi:GNAT superfamily N-acetyltransferase